ncbi:glycoside hydrolase family 27 protein [Neptunicella sp. SCSIO 80796]|uniref:glycoside hydrolase family 27 protein n=1 Tax=Neptunicella plasticusilytica TaxID=3117012 RepID=UPI003A4D60A1
MFSYKQAIKQLSLLLCSGLLLFGGPLQAEKFDNLAMTPPMGWNSWNDFRCEVDEKMLRETIDAMVSSGMRDAGYEYVNIDDCWHGERDAQGFIQENKQRFPSGMKALADYAHSKGLKLGIYSDAGWQTCARFPGSRGHEFQDAQVYASWGIDYLKYDWCYSEGLNAEGAYQTMREALHQAGRPILFSICEWGESKPWEWAKDVGHLWRTTGDIYACWDCENKFPTWSTWGVLKILDMQEGLRKYAGPGHWNDPDMLEVGNGLSYEQDRSHFALWAMLAAPLIAGNDIRHMSEQTKAILTNKGIIAVNQDAMGIQAFRLKSYSDNDNLQIWFKPLENGDWAMAVLNRGEDTENFRFDWRQQQVKDDLFQHDAAFDKANYRITDLWTNKELGQTLQQTTEVQIKSHDTFIVRLAKI